MRRSAVTRISPVLFGAALAAVTVAATGCDNEPPFPFATEEAILRGMPHLGPPPADPTNRFIGNEAAVALGLQLFSDASLSGCGTVSCQTCHEPDQGYTFRGAAGGPGCNGKPTGRNPPSLLNTAHSEWFMWDGRADRLWSQAALPYLDPGEMAGSTQHLRQKLSSEPYAAQYEALFGANAELHSEEQVLANFGKALAAYEWTLARTTSPFDRELDSYLEAVAAGTQESHPLHLGIKTFVRKGECAVCHKGAALSDQEFHNVGLADDTAGRAGRLDGIPTVLDSVFNARGEYSDAPTGRIANRLTNLASFFASAEERARANELGQLDGAFKTPSLRNVALTAPYMHNGKLQTLEEVIDFYDRGGDPASTFLGTRAQNIKPLELTAAEKAALLELLQKMTGDE